MPIDNDQEPAWFTKLRELYLAKKEREEELKHCRNKRCPICGLPLIVDIDTQFCSGEDCIYAEYN